MSSSNNNYGLYGDSYGSTNQQPQHQNTETTHSYLSSQRKFAKPLDAGKTELRIDESSFRREDHDLESHYRGDIGKRKSAVKTTLVNLVKAVVIMVLFAFFVGVVILIVQLVELFHASQIADYNIHIKLSAECEAAAMDINNRVTGMDPNQQINFNITHQPHVTLYLTRFISEFRDTIVNDLNNTLISQFNALNLGNCSVSTTTYFNVSGSYAMWDVQNSPCLQGLSNAIVNATARYVDPRSKSTIPSWVNNLPPQLRQVKILMIQQYGSPNVFSQFQPHVTIAHDDVTPTQLDSAVRAIGNPVPCTYKLRYVSIGLTGDYGTVLRGKDVAIFDLEQL
ncbi:hypothetical protein C9374_012678 [Naegleria lovaniensis]|uniref:Uncharacterized protein n=1 Tax=Naegleria lovaniensis TaxID=51637 RepID=A0AA88H3T3_NAELO|nr:uncharacterized protein C9374_012678 [Naegleria lovaniensis]KAG2392426.1 hypothetical protein C9374_012678 [Naegleria lovaniensis]